MIELFFRHILQQFHIIATSSGSKEEGGTGKTFPSPETRKICKGWGTCHTSASNENRMYKNFKKFSLNFSKFLLKNFKNFQNCFKNFQNFQLNFQNLFKL